MNFQSTLILTQRRWWNTNSLLSIQLSNLRTNAISTLDINAELLKKFPSLKIQVEGHCDERGSVQYNLALGEKRAESIKDYLVASGLSSDRISTISFGKERPISLEHNEMSWSKNRRGNFVIIAK